MPVIGPGDIRRDIVSTLTEDRHGNLWVAGRCNSSDEQVHGSIRVMPAAAMMGQAVGLISLKSRVSGLKSNPPSSDYGAASPSTFLLIHGERDELCPLRAVWEFYGHASEPKELVVIDAADHLFDGRVSEVADAIVDLLG